MKLYGKSSHGALERKLINLEDGTQDDGKIPHYRKPIFERDSINCEFAFKLQVLYRKMRKENITIKKPPSHDLQSFWSG